MELTSHTSFGEHVPMLAELFLAEPIPFWKDPTTVSAVSTVVIAVAPPWHTPRASGLSVPIWRAVCAPQLLPCSSTAHATFATRSSFRDASDH